MKNFKQGGGFGGKKRFDRGGGFNNGGRPERAQMFQAVCAECGKSCDVPFRPSGDRPVYCSDCFGRKDGGSNSRFEHRDSGRPNFGDKKMFEAICDKCHRACQVPFRPTGDKAVYCSDCFGKAEKPSAGPTAGPDRYQKQFELLNGKLDRILNLISPKIAAEKPAAAVEPAGKPAGKTIAVVTEKKSAPAKPAVKKAVKAEPKKAEPKKAAPKKAAPKKKAPAAKAAPKKAAKKKK